MTNKINDADVAKICRVPVREVAKWHHLFDDFSTRIPRLRGSLWDRAAVEAEAKKRAATERAERARQHELIAAATRELEWINDECATTKDGLTVWRVDQPGGLTWGVTRNPAANPATATMAAYGASAAEALAGYRAL